MLTTLLTATAIGAFNALGFLFVGLSLGTATILGGAVALGIIAFYVIASLGTGRRVVPFGRRRDLDPGGLDVPGIDP